MPDVHFISVVADLIFNSADTTSPQLLISNSMAPPGILEGAG